MAKACVRWTGRVLAGLVMAGLVGLPAWAEVREGEGLVTAKDVALGTLELNMQTYEVTKATILEGLEGEPITLEEVPEQGDPPFTGGQRQPGAVEYRASGRGERWRLLRLRLIPEIPR